MSCNLIGPSPFSRLFILPAEEMHTQIDRWHLESQACQIFGGYNGGPTCCSPNERRGNSDWPNCCKGYLCSECHGAQMSLGRWRWRENENVALRMWVLVRCRGNNESIFWSVMKTVQILSIFMSWERAFSESPHCTSPPRLTCIRAHRPCTHDLFWALKHNLTIYFNACIYICVYVLFSL